MGQAVVSFFTLLYGAELLFLVLLFFTLNTQISPFSLADIVFFVQVHRFMRKTIKKRRERQKAEKRSRSDPREEILPNQVRKQQKKSFFVIMLRSESVSNKL